MDTMPPLTISPILRQAAELKIDELNRIKEAFKRRYRLDVRRSEDTDTLTRVKSLIEDVKKLNPDILDNDDLDNLGTYLDLIEDDWSFTESKMLRFEDQICSKLRKCLNRLEVSSLHAELLRNAMPIGEPTSQAATTVSNIELDDFEVVEHERDEKLAIFEEVAFTARKVDVASTEPYLAGLFLNNGDQQELDEVRIGLERFFEELETDGVKLDQDFLMWCIVDLLGNDLIGDEKKTTLQAYLQSPIALRELASTINVKSICNWEYNADKGLPISTRRNTDGQYCVVLEEDIVDMLFLHSVGIKSAVKLRSCLMEFAQGYTSFEPERLTIEETRKREYFLGRTPPKSDQSAGFPNLCSTCHTLYPPAPMPPSPPNPMMMGYGPPPPPPGIVVIGYSSKKKYNARTLCGHTSVFHSHSNVAINRNSNYKRDFFMSRLPFGTTCTPKYTPSEEVQAKLLKTLGVELQLREALDGLVYTGSATFENLASGLPHHIALAVLRFLGVPETSLSFLERFLSAKVNLGPTGRGTTDRVVQRTRGVPENHALGLFLTEAVMFFLELAVRQETGSYLYRLNNECHFFGTYDQHEAYETQVSAFADVMGLEVSFKQNLSIGFLQLNPGSSDIDESRVKPYAYSTKKQLDACSSMLEWVRVWNGTVGTYASHLFGPPSNIFGKSHLDLVRKAYKTIFDIILGGETLTMYVKKLLVRHIGHALPESSFSLEAFIYLPQPYGGLGVKNPFVSLSLSREVRKTPDELIAAYIETEEAYYERAADIFATLPSEARARKLEALFESKDDKIAAALGPNRDLTVFMTKDELTEHRESCSYPSLPIPPYSPSSNFTTTPPPPPPPGLPMQPCAPPFMFTPTPDLMDLYKELLGEPDYEIPQGKKIVDEVRRLAGDGDMRPWRKLSGEEQWVLQLYGDECFEKFDGLEQWIAELVPQEVLRAVRGANWDEGDDDDSNCSSVTDMTEP